MRRLSLWILAVVLLAGGAAQAQQMFDITNPGDPLVGVPNDNNWPAAETPPRAIDDVISGAKYLCFKTSFVDLDGNVDPTTGGAGFRVTPSGPRVVVKALNFASANDAVERDPIAFRFSGSNESIDGPYTRLPRERSTSSTRHCLSPKHVDFGPHCDQEPKGVQALEVTHRGPHRARPTATIARWAAFRRQSARCRRGPVPVDARIDIPRDVVLAWTAGEMARPRGVFGTVFTDVNTASRSNPMGVLVSQGQTAATYDPAGLL
jgi:hypothetical protein